MDEIKYFMDQQEDLGDEEEYPEYILDVETPHENLPTKLKPRDEIKSPAFVNSKSPSFRDCDVTRAIKKPTVQDTINKIKQGVYLPKERPESKFTDNSQNSFPVRLEETNESESSIDLKANSDIDTPEEVEQLYQSLLRNVKTNSGFPKVTTVSQNSKNTNPQDSKKETQKDWITTQLYEDYEQYGKHEFNHAYDSMFYTESEIYNVYEFVKSRYNTKEYDKSVAPFYKKAMATLGELMFSMSLVSIFRSIEEMYNKISVTNTLKLLIRCRLLFDARRQVLEIFERIRMFKLLKTKVKNLISFQLDFGADATATHDKLKRTNSY